MFTEIPDIFWRLTTPAFTSSLPPSPPCRRLLEMRSRDGMLSSSWEYPVGYYSHAGVDRPNIQYLD